MKNTELELIKKLNHYGSLKEPFLFIINFDKTQYDIIKLDKLPQNIRYSICENILYKEKNKLDIKKTAISFKQYQEQFNKVQENIRDGNTYLLNLTSQTKLDIDISLEKIYEITNAKFKLLYKDKFVVFSPERFIQIKKNKIYTYPMKGTIDANIKDAKELILKDIKELSEHTMVVDLLRNDLGIIASNIKVEKFRYIDKIYAGKKELLQVSSKISGILEQNWQNKIGNIICSLLPAGSVTGTPKKKTVELIKEIENYNREYFTGIFGVFDGYSLDSGVMIRFIQKDKSGKLVYKSGGGITCDSDVKKEYQEMIEKVYI